VRELVVDTVKARSLERFLDHSFELPGDKTLQPAKALEFQNVAQSIDLAAAAGGGFGVTTDKA
jgi:hypothetical protein